MPKSILSLLLVLQLLTAAPHGSTISFSPDEAASAQPSRLWWGLIDPELSLWFSRLPLDEDSEAPVLWDWSWQGFLAALFGHPMTKEAIPHAPHA